MKNSYRLWAILFLTAVIAAACGSADTDTSDLAATNPSIPTEPPLAQATPTTEPVYQYNQLLNRDGIFPIYEPEFVRAADATLDDIQLVLGIELDGQAKAYPITVLNSREIVNDELAGIPILATW